MEKRCIYCGEIFRIPDYLNESAKYCSAECRERNSELRYERLRVYKTCRICGKSYYGKGKTCSHECAAKAIALSNRNKNDARRVQKECPVCKKSFEVPPSKADNYVTCGSEECVEKYKKIRMERSRVYKECPVCGGKFHGRNKTCGAECANKLKSIYAREILESSEKKKKTDEETPEKKPLTNIPALPGNIKFCEVCGRDYVGRNKTCSTRCASILRGNLNREAAEKKIAEKRSFPFFRGKSYTNDEEIIVDDLYDVFEIKAPMDRQVKVVTSVIPADVYKDLEYMPPHHLTDEEKAECFPDSGMNELNLVLPAGYNKNDWNKIVFNNKVPKSHKELWNQKWLMLEPCLRPKFKVSFRKY